MCILKTFIFSVYVTTTLRESKARDTEPFYADDFKMDYDSAEDYSAPLTTRDTYKLKALLRSMVPLSQSHSIPVADAAAYCRSLETCSECINAMWYPCGWCHNYGCTHKTELLCSKVSTLISKSNPRELPVCPSILNEGPLLIQVGNVNINVKIFGTDPILFEKEIICMLKLKQKVTLVKGIIAHDMVHCYPFYLDKFYVSDRGTFRLIWGGVRPFSNEIPAVVYDCDSLADTCEGCRALSSDYNCGWCYRTQRCVSSDKCGTDYVKWSLSKVACDSLDKKKKKRKLLYV